MYDINKRKNLSGTTVAQLINELLQLPPNAIVWCCGGSQLFLHVEQNGQAINFDTDDLDDIYSEE